jgi:hypothetical protein
MAPDWAPSLQQVGSHVPSRTRSVTTNDPLGTFSDDTAPTGTDVTQLIADACTHVQALTGLPVPAEATGQAQLAAALWAAYWVELGWPERDADVSVASQLRTDAEAATKAAVALVTVTGGATTVDPTPGDAALPSHTFLDPPLWADTTLIW